MNKREGDWGPCSQGSGGREMPTGEQLWGPKGEEVNAEGTPGGSSKSRSPGRPEGGVAGGWQKGSSSFLLRVTREPREGF